MTRLMLIVSTTIALALGLATVAGGQEATSSAGAGAVVVGVVPGGGTIFTKGSSDLESAFKDYTIGGTATVNLGNHLGIEGDVGGGIGVTQTLNFNNSSLANMRSPSTLVYSGDLAYYPAGKNRALVPYIAGGAGGLTLFARSDLAPLSVTNTTNLLTENIGGGVEWFFNNRWGVRGDYRYLIADQRNSANPFFGLNDSRSAHQIYGSLLWTFGR